MKTPTYNPFRSPQAKAEYLDLYEERARSWPVPSETKFIETKSGQTFVRASGNLADPPLVLLAGARAHSLTWIPIIAALAADYRTYALDSIYDVGLSISRVKVSKREDLILWLDEVLSVLAPNDPVHLMGISYGGWLASQYALQFAQRIKKLVFLSPAATVLPVSSRFLLRAALTILPGKAFVKQFLYWLLDDTVQSGQTGQGFVDQAVTDWIVAQRCFRPLPMIPATVLTDQELRSLEPPCLSLFGEHEKVYSAQKAVRRLDRVAPQIKMEIIPQAGHDLWVVQAELVAQKILDFLGEPGPLE